MELRLIYEDEEGRDEIEVTASRFTIGRHADNDFVIEDSNLSRRHALIENFDGVYFLSDCGSQNGTTLNGKPVSSQAEIHDGDVIVLGDAQELKVKFFDPNSPKPRPKSVSIKNSALSDRPTVSHKAPPPPQPAGISTQTIQILIAVIAVSVVLILGTVTVIVIGVSKGNNNNNNNRVSNNGTGSNNGDSNNGGSNNNGNDNGNSSTPSPDASPSQTESPTPTPNKGLDNLEKSAIQFLLLFNKNDTRKYAFDEKTLAEISQKAESYRGNSSVAASLKSIQTNIAVFTALANQNAIQPGLLIFIALAATDGGRSGDPLETAKSIAPFVLCLEGHFGDEDTDSSLIVVAAFYEKQCEKKSHPLLARLRRIISTNTIGSRNVWYLRQHDGIHDDGYNLVLKLIALGAISQNPQLFGVNTPPLTF